MVETITYQAAKNMTISYLQTIMAKQFPQERAAPTIVFNYQALSTIQLLSQVQGDTDIGRGFVNWYIGSLNTRSRQTGGPQYVIRG